MFRFRCGIFLLEVVQQVAYTHTVTADLVRIGRADTLSGRTDFARAFSGLVSGIQNAVCRKDQVSLFGDIELFGDVVATGSQGLSFLFEQERIQDYAISDHVDLSTLENSGGN